MFKNDIVTLNITITNNIIQITVSCAGLGTSKVIKLDDVKPTNNHKDNQIENVVIVLEDYKEGLEKEEDIQQVDRLIQTLNTFKYAQDRD